MAVMARLLLIGLLALALATAPVAAGVDAWTTAGPFPGTVDSLALDPSDRLIVYAGIRDLVAGRSFVFRSTDAGASWTEIAEAPGGPPISALLVGPQLPTRLYGATRFGSPPISQLFKSEDTGTSWRELAIPGPTAVHDLVAAAPASATIYAPGGSCFCFRACVIGQFCGAQILRSRDAGESWERASNGIQRLVSSLAVHPTDPRVLFAGTSEGVFKSSDAGDNWTIIGTGLDTCFFVSALAIHPGNPEILIAGVGGVFGGCGGVFRSLDGGMTWTRTALTSRPVTAVAFDPTRPDTLYAASGRFFGDGSQEVGITRSLDGGNTWTDFSAGLSGRSVYRLVIDPTGTFLHAGTDAGVFDYELRRLVAPTLPPSPRRPRTVPPREPR